MPGFLDAAGYGGTERIDVGGGYWIEVKRALSSAEYAPVEKHLGSGRMAVRVDGGSQTITVDPRGAQEEMLYQSVTAWNLDGDPWPDGTPWPLEPEKDKRKAIAALPVAVRIKVYQKCDELNGPREPEEAAQFPGEDVGGDPDGDGGTAAADSVPDPA